MELRINNKKAEQLMKVDFYLKKILLFIAIFLASSGSAQDYNYDIQLGAKGAAEVEQMIGIYPDSALNAYVNEVGQTLVRALGEIPFDFQFHVVDMEEPNAFALPGGYIYVSRGILQLMENEAELAGVLGHEIIHVTKRHSVKRMKKSFIPGLLQIPGAIVGGLVNEKLGNIINTPIALGSHLFLSNYSRKQEKEADILGIQLAAESDYDPSKLADILEAISRESEYTRGEKEQKNYFSSHPFTPKRLKEIKALAPTIDYSPQTVSTLEDTLFFSKLDGLIVGNNPEQGIFAESLFLHSGLAIQIQFPNDWETFNVPMAVGAIQPDGQAQLMMSIDTSTFSSAHSAKKFAMLLLKNYQIEASQNEAIDLHGFPGWKISFSEQTENGKLSYHVYWLQTTFAKLQIVCGGYPSFSQQLEKTAESIQPLTKENRNSIEYNSLHWAQWLPDESLEEFSDRVNNQWNLPELKRINRFESETLMKDKRYLKINKIHSL